MAKKKITTKRFRASDKKIYIIHRYFASDNVFFCAKRKLKRAKVRYIPIHNTGNKGRDTAYANANYFYNNKKVYAGAHFIIDLDGIIYQSGRLSDACYSVGGNKYENCYKTGGGTYFGKCNNYNQVSIELAGIVDNKPTAKQIAATRAVIEYIQKYCRKAKTIIRHFDVTGKDCPHRFSGIANAKAWLEFKKKIK